MKLSALLKNFNPRIEVSCSQSLDLHEIKRIVSKTSEAEENCLFVCTKTGLRDGHYGAVAAYHKGCRVFLAERGLALPSDATVLLCEDSEMAGAALAAKLLGNPANELTVYGVLGKAGKTTVAATLTQMLCGVGRRAAAIFTEGVFVDGRLHRFENSVPDGVELQYLLQSLAAHGFAYVTLEISSYRLLHKGANVIPFAAVLITDTADETAPPDCKPLLAACENALLIVPQRYRAAFPHERVLTYGLGGDCAATACEAFTARNGYGTRFLLSLQGKEMQISLPIPGDFAVQNALALALLASKAGLSTSEIARALSKQTMWGCLQCVAVIGGRYIYRDAAYSPEALSRALSALREQTVGKLTVVVGSVGGRAFERRAPLGRAAATCADLVYLTADNPDDESPVKICEEMAAGIDEPWRFVVLPDRAAAIRRAVLEMRPGDTLLIAGKAREDYQLLGGKRVPFDEVKLIKETAKQF